MATRAPRVVKPGGYLLLSFRGWNHFARIPTADRSRIERDGFVYADTGRTPGFPEFYQTAWHTASYVRRRWGEFFEVIDIVPVATMASKTRRFVGSAFQWGFVTTSSSESMAAVKRIGILTAGSDAPQQ